MCGTAYLLAVGSGQRRGNQGPFPRWPAQCPPQNATQIPRWQASAALQARLTSEPCHTEQGHARHTEQGHARLGRRWGHHLPDRGRAANSIAASPCPRA